MGSWSVDLNWLVVWWTSQKTSSGDVVVYKVNLHEEGFQQQALPEECADLLNVKSIHWSTSKPAVKYAQWLREILLD